MKITTIGINLAKEVFQIHGVDMRGLLSEFGIVIPSGHSIHPQEKWLRKFGQSDEC